MDGLHMVPLATTRSGFEARILAARLGADGILWQLRGGSVDSVYPVGSVDVLVAAGDLDRARELLAATDESDDAMSVLEQDADTDGWGRTEWWFAAILVALLSLFIVVRMFSL